MRRPRPSDRIRAWLRSLPDLVYRGRSVPERLLLLYLKDRPLPRLRAFLRAVELELDRRRRAFAKMRPSRVREGESEDERWRRIVTEEQEEA